MKTQFKVGDRVVYQMTSFGIGSVQMGDVGTVVEDIEPTEGYVPVWFDTMSNYAKQQGWFYAHYSNLKFLVEAGEDNGMYY